MVNLTYDRGCPLETGHLVCSLMDLESRHYYLKAVTERYYRKIYSKSLLNLFCFLWWGSILMVLDLLHLALRGLFIAMIKMQGDSY